MKSWIEIFRRSVIIESINDCNFGSQFWPKWMQLWPWLPESPDSSLFCADSIRLFEWKPLNRRLWLNFRPIRWAIPRQKNKLRILIWNEIEIFPICWTRNLLSTRWNRVYIVQKRISMSDIICAYMVTWHVWYVPYGWFWCLKLVLHQ